MGAEPIRVALPESMAPEATARLRRRLLRATGPTVVLDGGRLAGLDTVGAARLLALVADARAAGRDVRLAGLPEDARRLLAEVDPAILDEGRPPPRPPVLEAIGAGTLAALDAVRAVGRLLSDTAAAVAVPFGRRGVKWDRTLQQMALVGAAGVPIVAFISLLIGVVLALNGATQLRQFGAAIFIANLVAISMTREMGPLITAIIVSGRTGSAIAAEIGTMVISEEIDAMKTMALSPIRFLVAPKVLALMLMLPLLTVIANVAGIGGGYLVGVMFLDLGSSAYLSQTVQALFVSDVLTGLVKSVVFAVLIGLVGVYRGFTVRGGPEAVGRATTSAVVTAIISCIIANAGFTAFFYVSG